MGFWDFVEKHKKKMQKRMYVLISKEDLDKLRKIKAKLGISMGELIGLCVEYVLKEEEV